MPTATSSPVHERINQLTAEIKIRSALFTRLSHEIGQVLVGQHQLIQRMFVGLLGNGHLLIEGVPGLAKTTAVACLAKGIDTGFQRLQFTPDLLPADLMGTLIYRPQDQHLWRRRARSLEPHSGRRDLAAGEGGECPLEAMQERQVTIGTETYPLDEPFLVMATQNPIEQEGTYPLPEAQMDRFMMKVVVRYPNREEELVILDRMSKTRSQTGASGDRNRKTSWRPRAGGRDLRRRKVRRSTLSI